MTAYEMCISDWSSDVCSSDLVQPCFFHPQPPLFSPHYQASILATFESRRSARRRRRPGPIQANICTYRSRKNRATSGPMGGLILRRLLTGLPTLLLVVGLSFLLMKLAPGGPFDGERVLDPVTEAALARRYGLDQPLGAQFLGYVGGLARGDFGPSMVYRDFTVTELIARGLPVSLMLGAAALALALAAGIPLGCWAAWREGRMVDRGAMLGATLLNALPTFVTAPLLVLVFGLWMGWLPVSGWRDGDPAALILPAVALALPTLGAVMKLTRAGLSEVMGQDFIRTARAKGDRKSTRLNSSH